MAYQANTNWYYEWNDGSYRKYDNNVSQWLNNANVNDSKTIQIGSNNYQMLKTSNHDCSQTNVRSQFSRKGISQYKYNKMNNNSNNYNSKGADTGTSGPAVTSLSHSNQWKTIFKMKDTLIVVKLVFLRSCQRRTYGQT